MAGVRPARIQPHARITSSFLKTPSFTDNAECYPRLMTSSTLLIGSYAQMGCKGTTVMRQFYDNLYNFICHRLQAESRITDPKIWGNLLRYTCGDLIVMVILRAALNSGSKFWHHMHNNSRILQIRSGIRSLFAETQDNWKYGQAADMQILRPISLVLFHQLFKSIFGSEQLPP
jgi:hypothetical protein